MKCEECNVEMDLKSTHTNHPILIGGRNSGTHTYQCPECKNIEIKGWSSDGCCSPRPKMSNHIIDDLKKRLREI